MVHVRQEQTAHSTRGSTTGLMGARTGSELGNHAVNYSSLDAVYDVIAGARDIVAVLTNLYVHLRI